MLSTLALLRRLARFAAIRAEDIYHLLTPLPTRDEWRLLSAVRRYTMLGPARLRTLYRLANQAEREHVPGSFVECGTCNGGSGAILARVASQSGRPVWLFDSFQGLPEPTALDGAEATGWTGACLGNESSVREVLARVRTRPDGVNIISGWFDDTLEKSPTGPIALLHLDGDWYESTVTILEALYDRIDPRGYLVIDDYGHWVGCKRAVDEFFAKRHLTPVVVRSDYTGVWLRKPQEAISKPAA
jgi:Macrocin-O-methyltransferase (TylF)